MDILIEKQGVWFDDFFVYLCIKIMNMRKILLLTLLLLCFIEKHHSYPYYIERLGVMDGLSNTSVIDITQDKLGFVWFATEEGLNMMNGNRIISYFKSENNSITGNELNCVLDDPVDSLLWIGTQRSGLNVYDYVNDKFTSYVHDENNPDALITNDITDLQPSHDGNIWISTYWEGIDYFDKKTGKFIHYNSTTMPGLKSNKVWTVCDAGDGNLYVGHVDSGMSIISLSDRTVKNYMHNPDISSSLPGNVINSIFKDSFGNVWVGTDNGLALFDSSNEKFINFSDIDHRLRYCVYDIMQSDNNLWVATDFGGVVVLQLSHNTSYHPDETSVKVINNVSGNYSMSSSSVRSVFADSFSNIWLGLWGGGVGFISGGNSLFNNYISLNYPDDNALDNSNILTVCCYDDDKILVGKNNGGISIISEGNVLNKDVLGKGNTKVVQSSLCLSSGDVLLGLYGGGLKKFDKNKETVDNLLNEQCDNLDVRSIYEAGDGYVWLSTSNGAYKLDKNNYGIISHYDIGNNMIRGIVNDSNGNFFMATFGDGLFILDKDFNILKTYNVSSGFTSNTVNHLFVDCSDNVWVATGEGLVMFSPGNYDEYKVYTRKNGLNNIHIRAVIEDNWHNIWISTNRGISCKRENSDEFINYTEYDNIPVGSFNSAGVSKDNDGIIYFTSTDGLCYFNPYNVLSVRKAPEPFISSLIITDGLDTQEPQKTVILPKQRKTLELDYFQNNFSVSFNVLNYALKKQVEYAYMLKGFDPSWYTVDDPNSIAFRNISYGEYELRVKSRMRNQEWNDDYISMPIIIKAPIWFSWWAKMIYIVLFILLVYVSLRFYRRRLNLLYLYRMEKENHAKEQELNQERLRFYTNITHELRTPLTLIIGPLEDMIISNTLVDKDKQKINVIYKSALRLLNLINQILEFRKTETQNRKLCVTYGNICTTIYEVGLKFKELNNNNNVEFKIETCSDHINVYYDKEIVTMILDNLISNAFKYTNNGEIKLKVEKKNIGEEGVIEIKVSDTGYGISKEAIPYVFDRYYQEKGSHQASGTGIGLALVKKLIELHHARIFIESKVNEGTEFTILLKADYTYPDDLHNDDSAVCLENEDIEAINTSGCTVNSEKPILLVVEDNEDIKNYVADSLSDSYDVRTADNGKIGLQIALDIVPDVIVCDIMMPEMDGMEVCRTIKNNMCTSHIPVILLTAKNTLHDKEEGYTAGADSYITKPFSASLLKARIGNILEARKKISEKISNEYGVREKRKFISDSTTKLDNDFLQKFNGIVEANLSSDKVDVGYIADKLCMSNSTLYRKVKALTGLSTNEYIRKIKMKHAEQLLLEGKYNISEIAFMVGMNSTVYFRQCFKEEFGVVPSDYVKKIKE